jgi:hypothetical protein
MLSLSPSLAAWVCALQETIVTRAHQVAAPTMKLDIILGSVYPGLFQWRFSSRWLAEPHSE